MSLPVHEVVGLGVPGPGDLFKDDEFISLHNLLLLNVVLTQQSQTVSHLFQQALLLLIICKRKHFKGNPLCVFFFFSSAGPSQKGKACYGHSNDLSSSCLPLFVLVYFHSIGFVPSDKNEVGRAGKTSGSVGPQDAVTSAQPAAIQLLRTDRGSEDGGTVSHQVTHNSKEKVKVKRSVCEHLGTTF